MLRQILTLEADRTPPQMLGAVRTLEKTAQPPDFQWVLQVDGKPMGYSAAARCLPKQNVVSSAYALPTFGEGDHLFGCEFVVDATLSTEEILGFHQFTRDAFVREMGFRSIIVQVRLDVPTPFSVGAWVQQAIHGSVEDPIVSYLCDRSYFELAEFESQSVWRWFNPQ